MGQASETFGGDGEVEMQVGSKQRIGLDVMVSKNGDGREHMASLYHCFRSGQELLASSSAWSELASKV